MAIIFGVPIGYTQYYITCYFIQEINLDAGEIIEALRI